MSTHIRPEDVTPDSDPNEVAESLVDDLESGNFEEAEALNEAASEQGVGQPDEDHIEAVEEAVVDAVLSDDS